IVLIRCPPFSRAGEFARAARRMLLLQSPRLSHCRRHANRLAAQRARERKGPFLPRLISHRHVGTSHGSIRSLLGSLGLARSIYAAGCDIRLSLARRVGARRLAVAVRMGSKPEELSLARSAQPVGLHSVNERPAGDAEERGGTGLVSARLIERGEDALSLEV